MCAPVIDRTARIGRTRVVVLCPTCGAVVDAPGAGDATYVPAHAPRGR